MATCSIADSETRDTERFMSGTDGVASDKEIIAAAQERRAWKVALQSLRLISKAFTDMHIIEAALFHDLYLYASAESLRRLEEISHCPRISPHVRRIVFMCPQVDGGVPPRPVYGLILSLCE